MNTDETTYLYYEEQNLGSIQPGSKDINVKCILIGKIFPRLIKNKDRMVLNITVRDLHDFVNVVIWGGKNYIDSIYNQFHIGNGIELISANAENKTDNDVFRPSTPCSYFLVLTEGKSLIKSMDIWSMVNFNRIVSIPVVQNPLDYYYIQDIISSGELYVGESINILAAVKNIGIISEFQSKKNGKLYKKLDVKLFDITSEEIQFIIWDEALIEYALTWVPKQTVLFVVDAKIIFNKFRNLPAISTTGKTLITINPMTKEGFELHKYTETVTFKNQNDNAFFDIMLAQDKLKSSEIKQKMKYGKDFICIFVGFLTFFDIDGENRSVVTNIKRIKSDVTSSAMLASTNIEGKSENYFSINMDLTDNEGTIECCWLSNKVAEIMLGCTADEYLRCSNNYKTERKWHYLFEKCKFIIKVMHVIKDSKLRCVIKVLSCARATVDDLK